MMGPQARIFKKVVEFVRKSSSKQRFLTKLCEQTFSSVVLLVYLENSSQTLKLEEFF